MERLICVDGRRDGCGSDGHCFHTVARSAAGDAPGPDRRPDQCRARHEGTAVSLGRVGAVVGSQVGRASRSSPPGSDAKLSSLTQLFQALVVLMSVVFVALASLRRHIPNVHATSGSPEVAGR